MLIGYDAVSLQPNVLQGEYAGLAHPREYHASRVNRIATSA